MAEKSNLKYWLINLALALGILCFLGVNFWNKWQLSEYGQETVGRIVEKYHVHSGRTGCVYHFFANGKTYINSFLIDDDPFWVGDTVTITYMSSDPNDNHPAYLNYIYINPRLKKICA